eukprot:s4326_g5.t2
MFPFAEPLPDRSRPPDIEGPVRKCRAGRSGAASLPAKRRRTTTSTLRWASSLASKRADAVSASAAPAPTFSLTSHVHGKVPTNDDGFMIRLGTQDGFRGRWYCGRILDPSDIPGASEQCGPEGGPQCHSCARYQATYEPDLNDDGYPVKRSLNTKSCFLFYCGRSGVVAGTGGKCAGEGPQCPSCQRLQQSFKAGHVNDEGCIVMLGTTKGYTGLFYCGRVLGVRVIPDSDGRCGPSDGPQCPSCKRYQKSQQVVIDEDEPKPSETPHAPAPPEAQRPVQAPLAKVKRELPDQQAAPPAPPAPPAPAEAPRARADTRPTSQDRPQAPSTSTVARGTEDTRRSGKEPSKGRQSTRQEAVPDLPQPKRLMCSVCERSDHPETLLLCDGGLPGCEESTHLGCCNPPLKAVPEGDWFCASCQKQRRKPGSLAKPKSAPVVPAVPRHHQKGKGKGGGKGEVQSLGAALKVAAAEVPKPRTLD